MYAPHRGYWIEVTPVRIDRHGLERWPRERAWVALLAASAAVWILIGGMALLIF